MPRSLQFAFSIEMEGEGKADERKVEEMLDLALKDLIYDDNFIAALDEKQAVTIQLMPLPINSLVNQNKK